MEVTLNTIPAWIPGIIMLYTGIIWLITRKLEIRMDSRIVAVTLILWGTLYTVFSQSSDQNINLIARLLMSRVVISLICLSQCVPMTISAFRSRIRGG